MRLSLTPSELAIRDEMAAFLREHTPAPEDVPTDFDARIAFLRGWQGRLHAAGLVNLAWPREAGGRGATLMEQLVANAELARAGAPELIGVVGLDVVGPTIVEHGTPAQKQAFLPRILSAEDIWCQGFSEPNAGSDLASLRTTAEDRGDHFVVRGEKTWTSWAQYANWCAVLARTDPEASAHRGISYLIVDMRSPGIDVRPLVQVTGDPEFSEVYFDDVVVPRDMLLGELNTGWGLAMHTLMNERGPVAAGRQVKLRVLLDTLIEEATRLPRDGGRAIDEPSVRAALARAHVELEVLRHQAYRSVGAMVARGRAGFDSSVDKLFMASAEQRLGEACVAVLGPNATRGEGARWNSSPARWQSAYFYGRAASIYGGTAQVQRNIVAERILGLPRST